MKIGILSDTHNDENTLKLLLAEFRNQSISTIIHCGDLTSPSVIPLFDQFQVFFAYGNCDYFSGQIADELIMLGTNSASGHVLSITLDGQQVGVTHGHDQTTLDQMIQSGRYRYIFTGHTHQANDAVRSSCRIINPGAAHTRGYHRATFAILDLLSNELEIKRL